MIGGKIVLTCVVAGLIAGCATSSTVRLQHPETGDIIQCGPFRASGNIPAGEQTVLAELRYCIEDFQRQGYERLPD